MLAGLEINRAPSANEESSTQSPSLVAFPALASGPSESLPPSLYFGSDPHTLVETGARQPARGSRDRPRGSSGDLLGSSRQFPD
jgi:hypothetical protein